MTKSEGYKQLITTEVIDGITYTSTKFPATKSLALLGRSVSALGEAGLHTLVMANLKSLGMDLSNLAAGAELQVYGAAVQVAYGLAQDETLPIDLVANLKASALRPSGGGGPVAAGFDSHFAGELMHLARVLGFVLAHNFAGFTLGSPSPGGSLTSDEPATVAPSDSPIQSQA